MTLEDASFVHELMTMPKWYKYIGDRGIKSVQDAEDYIRNRFLAQYEKLGYSNNVLILKESNETIGTCGLHDREGVEGIDLGYAILTRYEGKGYITEAAKAIISFVFEELELDKLSAITTEENIASNQLLLKLGFQYRKIIQLPGSEQELKLYELLAPG